jgi:hypothetical protein
MEPLVSLLMSSWYPGAGGVEVLAGAKPWMDLELEQDGEVAPRERGTEVGAVACLWARRTAANCGRRGVSRREARAFGGIRCGGTPRSCLSRFGLSHM